LAPEVEAPVRWWRLSWLAFVLAFAALIVVAGVHVIVDHFTREPPNYSRIEDGLWLGGYVAEPPPGTRAVLNLCESEDAYHVESHRWEPIRDAEPAPSLDWLREQVRFIEAERTADRTVYIHCRNGASRSGMVVVAYYMARNGWSRDEAMEFVRARRPELRPNPAFMELLLVWERSLVRPNRVLAPPG
jgi:hypothetical protein